jgi:hypothetical protein
VKTKTLVYVAIAAAVAYAAYKKFYLKQMIVPAAGF